MKILYFAWLRQHVGAGEETLALPATVKTAGELIDWLILQSPGHATAFENRDSVRIAIDQEFAEPEDSILGAGEVAFFPPVTGG
ncbi:MAG: molybdopterin converting factor subunit 1 [Alphaproteobacteria bacterium]